VKVRFQSEGRLAPGQAPRYSGVLNAYATIVRTEGVAGLWTGLGPNIARNSIINASELASYDTAKEALRAAGAGLLQQVEVWPAAAVGTSPQDLTFRVTFVGVAGNQELLTVEVYAGAGGITCNPDHPAYAADTAGGTCAAGGASRTVYRKTVGNRPETECATRGNCDYKTGVCKCFTGFYGAACENQNALAA